MFNILTNLYHFYSKKYYTGANPDTRSSAEIAKDWLHEEIATSTTINYVTKDQADSVKGIVPVLNQKATSSCVAHSTTTEIAILIKQKLGIMFKGMALFIYRLRSNYSGEGMIGNNSNEIVIDKGVPSASLAPDPTTEADANAMVITQAMLDDASKQKPIGYFKFQTLSWQNIASVVSNGKAVKIFIDATIREWSQEFVKIMDTVNHGYAPVSHAITILPNTVFKQNGEEYAIVQDSAWFGGLFYRYIPKSFFDAGRCYYSSYLTDLTYTQMQNKPIHDFKVGIKYGDKSEEASALQVCLIYEGLLPAECQTGYFAGLTLKAVKNFQLKYASDILAPLKLTQPTGIVGLNTVKKLNELFNNF